MICIYESIQTGVPLDNGLGALSPSSCIITEELNGQLELYMTHPMDEDGKWEKIDEQRIIKAPYNHKLQLFRIYNSFKDPIAQKTIIVQARHISYDLLYNFLEDVRPTVKNGQDAGEYILDNCQDAHDFTFSSDITDISTAYYVRQNPIAAFIGSADQSFINRWGGEIGRDNYNIAINNRVGAANGVRIAYRKNLTGLEITVDDSAVVTRVMPTALDENGVLFTTTQKYYDSPLINNYPQPRYGELKTGIRVGAKVNGSIPYPDEASAITAMEAMVTEYFNAGADKPKTTLNVSYIDLGKTEEYSEYAALFSAGLGDDITVYYPAVNIDIKLRMISMQWNAILDQPYFATLGNFEPNLAKVVIANDINVSTLKNDIAVKLTEGEVYNGITMRHEDGVVTSAIIDGVLFEVKQNAQEGLALYADGKYLGGPRVINGKAAFIGNILTNDIDGDCYATIGEFEDGGTTYTGISIYRKVNEAFVLMGHISVNEAGSLHLRSDGARIAIQGDGSIVMHDSAGIRAVIGVLYSIMYSPNRENGIGVDNDGAYKLDEGSKTRL